MVALGSVSRTLPIPGLAEHAIGLKSLADATALRNQVLSCLDIAESLEDPAERASYLGFVFVGAGYAGVEGLAELQDFASRVIELYPRCRAQGMRWVLVEARERIMGEVSKGLSRFAKRELEGRGIEVLTDTTLREVSEISATLSNGQHVAARTVVWTAGVKPAPEVAQLGLPLDAGGRIVADSRMRVEGHHGQVWAIGDCAAVPDPAHRGRPCPPTAQHALRQGRRVARNVAATLGNGREKPFRWRTLGVVAELGHNQAVAITARHPLARPPRLVHRPHLPPPADARPRPQAPPPRRLERRPPLRPRRLRPRPSRQPHPARTRRGGLRGR